MGTETNYAGLVELLREVYRFCLELLKFPVSENSYIMVIPVIE